MHAVDDEKTCRNYTFMFPNHNCVVTSLTATTYIVLLSKYEPRLSMFCAFAHV